MPFTAFHFGPGAVINALAPRHASFLAICTANVVMDVEPLYYMGTDQYPLHRFFHTYIGAALIAAITVIAFVGARAFAERFWLPDVLGWRRLTLLSVAIGATVGSYSHIVLDSIMHSDIRPFAPFSDSNQLLSIIPTGELHLYCALAGLASLPIIAVRVFSKRQHAL